MFRFAICVLILLLIGGCRAPMPKFKPLAAYGPTRIPPPATGSFASGNAYYQPPSASPVSTAPLSTTPIGTGFNTRSTATEGLRSQPSMDAAGMSGHTAQLSVPAPTAVAGVPSGASSGFVPTASVVPPSEGARVALTPPPLGGSSSFAASLRGMPVNDLTDTGRANAAAAAAANAAVNSVDNAPGTINMVPGAAVPVGNPSLPIPGISSGVIDIGQLPNASSAILRTSPPTTLASTAKQTVITPASTAMTGKNVSPLPSGTLEPKPSGLQAAGWQIR